MVTPTSSGAAPAQRVREVVEPVVRAAGLHLEDVVVAPAGRRTVVRVVVDLDEDAVGSLDLDTVGEVSRDISAALDAADPVRGVYVLEVSTPGTDRPLTELRHVRRARTRVVRLTLHDGSTVRGRVVTADPDGYVLDPVPDGVAERTTVAPADVARGHVEVELNRLPAEDTDGASDAHDDEEDED
ncbi:ribosome maturation factor RimP [Actinotalea solisilvae]|uniref:ribosome maturation factor RimP n=1 Tax=Actinotalea solisilvae TaxID=2072922 RepID=UPI0018F16901|nr:ribosome maturation factor RimP [Actinotalea solisilvae]